MINKEKVRLMSQMAMYEQGEGKEYGRIAQYYRRDYIWLQMIKAFFCGTIAFFLLYAMKICYELDTWLEELYQMDYMVTAAEIIVFYLVFSAINMTIAWFVANARYNKGVAKQKVNLTGLKRLKMLYQKKEQPEDTHGTVN